MSVGEPTNSRLAPGVPHDYYRSIADIEDRHWWHRGMREITRALLGERLRTGRLLDAGCGTGGFMRWALDSGLCASACGVDVSSAAIELARERVPEADLHVAPLWELPIESEPYDLVVMNDVLQHLPERQVGPSLRRLGDSLSDSGTLLIRTNGTRRTRRVRDDWRAYDGRTLKVELEDAGLAVDRVTYANLLLSLVAAITGQSPQAPTEDHHGIPVAKSGRLRTAAGRFLLGAEAHYLSREGRRLPYGHTLFALASRGDHRGAVEYQNRT